MHARYFALVMGILFVLAGVGGFVPWVTPPASAEMPELTLSASYGSLLGLFPINALHNLIHLGLGLWGLVAWRRTNTARRYAQGLAWVLASFTLLGLAPTFATMGGLLPLFGHDIWLHALEAVVAGYVGYLMPEQAAYAAP
jgi:hypothetical protein